MFKFFKKKAEEVPLPPPQFKAPLQEPLKISVPAEAPSIVSSVPTPVPEPIFHMPEPIAEDLSTTASVQIITQKTETKTAPVRTEDQTLLEPTQPSTRPSPEQTEQPPEEQTTKPALQFSIKKEILLMEKPIAEIVLEQKLPDKKTQPSLDEEVPKLTDEETRQSLDEEFVLPDFDDLPSPRTEEKSLEELPSFEDMPKPKIQSISIFIRAFDYLRIMNEKKRITTVIAQTYKQTEDLTKIANDQLDLYEQWYSNLNTCQEKLIHIDTNLFEQVKS